ncbi:hypothetical protein OG429_23165 [Streptomyces sp. NBC_00190]|uniref:hypothetical protein n=1 Tax=unclassified Streptomyces TaxID=2593676 RepID=UPI002E28CCC0|nr:hypothetical protein [Streptomyces sp. NBC_00190]WSZ41934.1 hypothetical protein OG239_25940 [Streptomyces sp. NBC_00868]
MSAPSGAHREPRPSAVSMRALLAAGMAATAVSTPPAPEHVPQDGPEGGVREQAAPESEAA